MRDYVYPSVYFAYSFFFILAVGALLMMRVMQLRWTRTWAEKGGRARVVLAS